MEADSSIFSLMDTSDYLIDDWDFDFPLVDETVDHSLKTKHNRSQDSSQPSGASVCERPARRTKANNVTTTNKSSSPSSQIISFENSNSSPPTDTLNFSDPIDVEQYGCLTEFGQGMSNRKEYCPVKRQPHLLKEHVLAERKRRQKLNERLIALSALIPGLKKVDKASVLEDAIKHLKQLQDQIKELEEERVLSNNKMESVILVKKSRVCICKDSSSASSSSPTLSSDEDSDGQFSGQTLPQIEARVSNNNILIKIHCEKSENCVVKILSAVQKLRLDVINSFTLPFGSSTLDITFLAKMDKSFPKSVEDVVKNIRLAMVD